MAPRFLEADFKRVVYEKNPLNEVICQFRFSHLLKIDSEVPAAFQEAIKSEYPILEIQDGVQVMLSNLDAPQPLPIKKSRAYAFFTEDRSWQVTLSPEFIALTAFSYECWEAFAERFDSILSAFQDQYRVSRFTRVGLRYKNIIDRGELGLQEPPWHELVEPHALGWLGSGNFFERDMVSLGSSIEFAIQEAAAKIRAELLENSATKQQAILLDADFFANNSLEQEAARRVVDELHAYSGPFFRWCITDKLHEALGPREVGS